MNVRLAFSLFCWIRSLAQYIIQKGMQQLF